MKKCIILFLCFCFTIGCYCQEYDKVNNMLNLNGEAKILVKIDDKDIDKLSRFTSIDSKINNEYLVYVNHKEFHNFLTLGFDYRLFESKENEKALQVATSVEQMQSWNYYPSYQVYLDLMHSFAEEFPEICSLDTIGFSENNRLLLALKIHNGDDSHNPKFFYASTIHGDEPLGCVMLLHLADYILHNFQTDTLVENIISNTQIYISPLLNPDGMYAGGNNKINNSTRYNANYVDLNRNFPNPLLGSNPDGEEYQIETLQLMQYSQEESFDLSVNIHTGAEVCNYPWDSWRSFQRLHPDRDWFINNCQQFVNEARSIAGNNYFTDVCNSGIILGADWYPIYGSYQDWLNWYTGTRDLTLEISTEKKPSSNLLPSYWEYLKLPLLNYIKNTSKGIEGIIKDNTNNQVIDSAKIEILGLDDENSFVYSNTNGYFFRPLLAGNYEIKIEAEGYNDTIINITIENDSTLFKTINLSPTSTSIESVSDDFEQEFLVYPNPCFDKLYVKLNTAANYTILDVEGRSLLSGNLEKGITTLDVSKLKSRINFLILDFKKIKQRIIFIKR